MVLKRHQELEKGDIVRITINEGEIFSRIGDNSYEYDGPGEIKAKIGRKSIGNFGTGKEVIKVDGEVRNNDKISINGRNILLVNASKDHETDCNFAIRIGRTEIAADVEKID